MDKRVIFAVAGSGKTFHIISELTADKRILIVTYTEENYQNLRKRILNKFGYFPENIILLTYFRFLHGFCYKPFLSSEKRTRGILFKMPPSKPNRKIKDEKRYISTGNLLYSNRLAKFLEIEGLHEAIRNRIEKYFDVFYIDEVQDFAGHDFNFLMAISKTDLEMKFVGDFYQHTYDTSRDGNVNASLHSDYEAYLKRFKNSGFKVDINLLNKSRRCSTTVCEFITKKIGIPIESHDVRSSSISLIENQEAAQALYHNRDIVKLFFQEHWKFNCYSQNWGASKGVDKFLDVCVVLSNANLKLYKTGDFKSINPQTRNKLYVACSRARRNLIFMPESFIKQHKRNT